MLSETLNLVLKSAPALRENGISLARAVHDAVLNGGSTTRMVADLLHGTWLGHPLHPVLTDVTIGAWSLGTFFDLLSLVNGSEEAETTADSLTRLGNLSALPTALAGLADYSAIPRHAADTGLTHAALNGLAYGCYLASAQARGNGTRDRAIALSTIGATLMLASAYLGGHMVYDQRVGVNHAIRAGGPKEWTPVLALDELPQGRPQRIMVENSPVLLYRGRDRVMAIGAICAHAGGPLEEGDIYENGHGAHVQCPWHDSVFDLEDGSVVHGPSTYAVPAYDTRVRDGRIELRLSPQKQLADQGREAGRLIPGSENGGTSTSSPSA